MGIEESERAIWTIKKRMEETGPRRRFGYYEKVSLEELLEPTWFARGERLIDSDSLLMLGIKIGNVRNIIFKSGKPKSPGDLRTFRLDDGELLAEASIQEDPEEEDNAVLSVFSSRGRGISYVSGFDGSYILMLDFDETNDYYSSEAIEQMTAEEYDIVDQLLTDVIETF